MKAFLGLLLLLFLSPIELVLGLVWLLLWLITIPFDKVFDNLIQKATKNNLLKGIK